MAARPTGVCRRPGPDLRARMRMMLCLTVLAVFATRGVASARTDLRGLVLIAGRPAPNVVVWLDVPQASADVQTDKVVLDQRSLRFSPQVLAVRVGTSVEFPNNDRVFHNVFSFHHGKVFDLGLYPVGASKVVQFDKPGVSRIFCNIHPNMAAYVYAVDSPYFAVSDESGAFTLRSVPPGGYTYRAWRAGAAALSGAWPVTTSGAAGTLVIEWAK
jgi:plastocyanin